MVNNCVNPACSTELKILNTGELYALESQSANTKFFWLCPACIPEVTLGVDPMGSLSVRKRSDSERPQPPHPDNRLRLVFPIGERTLRGLRRDPLSLSYVAA